MVLGFVTEEQAQRLHQVAERLEEHGLHEESDVLQALIEEIGGQSATLSTAEAAEILCVTQQTVRNWVRAGIRSGGRDPTGHIYVLREALVPAIQMRRATPDIVDTTMSDEDIDSEIAAVRANRRATTTGLR